MNSTITEKDKKLLFFCGLFLIVIASIFWIIIPTSKKISKAQNENKELVQKQEEMQTSINNIQSYKATKTDIENEYQEMSSKVFSNFKEYDMDRSLTQIVIDNGLEPTSLSISSINGVKILPYKTSKTYNTDQKQVYGVVADNDSKIKAANISISAEGPAQNILKYLNVLDSQSGILIQESKITLGQEKSKIDVTVSLILGENDF